MTFSVPFSISGRKLEIASDIFCLVFDFGTKTQNGRRMLFKFPKIYFTLSNNCYKHFPASQKNIKNIKFLTYKSKTLDKIEFLGTMDRSFVASYVGIKALNN